LGLNIRNILVRDEDEFRGGYKVKDEFSEKLPSHLPEGITAPCAVIPEGVATKSRMNSPKNFLPIFQKGLRRLAP
jgi:hypothetical protein